MDDSNQLALFPDDKPSSLYKLRVEGEPTNSKCHKCNCDIWVSKKSTTIYHGMPYMSEYSEMVESRVIFLNNYSVESINICENCYTETPEYH